MENTKKIESKWQKYWDKHKSFKAKDMDIKIVEDVDSMNEKELDNAVSKLWMR